MKFTVKLLLLTLSTLLYANVEVRFQPMVRSDSTHLGQVLLFTPAEKQLSMLPLDNLLIGQSMLSQAQIIAWLEQTTHRDDYSWQGKTTVLIKQITQSSSDALIATAQAHLLAILQQEHYDAIQLNAKTKPTASVVPLAALKVEIKNSYPARKRMCVRLYNEHHIIPIWFEVHAQQSVLVARTDINKRTLLKADDFVLEQRDITGLSQTPYQVMPHHSMLKKALHAHEILTPEHIMPMPLIMKNSKTKLYIHSLGITITTEAIAQEDGYLGQNIALHPQNTKKSIRALVIAPNEAEVS